MSSESFISRLSFHRSSAKGPKLPKNKQHGDPKVGMITSSGSSPSPSTAISKPDSAIARSASPAQQPTAPSSATYPLTQSVPTVSGLGQSLSRTESTSAKLSERLWNRAYDELKKKDTKLVDAYEKILSQELKGDNNSGNENPLEENSIEQSDTANRWLQMEALIQAGLKKTETEANVKQAAGNAMQGVLSLRDVVGSALQTVPQAALAWTGVCFALQIFVNPVTETDSNRNGIVHVILRMKWYCELSSLLLKENTIDNRPLDGIRVDLERRVIDLYHALLLYLIKSVCSYYRNRFVIYLRDMLKLDDWDGNLQSVKDAEEAVRRDSNQYNTQKIVLHLEQLVNIAKNEEAKHLQGIHSLLQKQVSVQLKMEDNECLRHLRLSDPRDDMKRIMNTKGGLLEDTYRWILDNPDFRKWRNDDHNRLLWIKGDPGKGKTMLLCGIINELSPMGTNHEASTLVVYFFCQAADLRINSAASVLRGLIYLLVVQQPPLIRHVREKYDHAGKQLFEDANAWTALTEIFTNVLQDPGSRPTYMIIDALDECVTDRQELLDFIAEKSPIYSHVKWIVSSRNWPEIEKGLRTAEKVRLSLELNAASISTAVGKYIQHKVNELTLLNTYNDTTRDAVQHHLLSNAHDTFLWVALVCQELRKVSRLNTLAKLKAFPPGLDPLYQRMMEQIYNSDNADLCKQILAVVSIVYRPIILEELTSFVESLGDISDDFELLSEIIGLCGSFLTLRERTVYFVHQSATDFLLKKAANQIFSSGTEEIHHTIFSKSLDIMSETLQRNMYSLDSPGFPIDQVKRPQPDPLAAVRYSCVYWVDHLCDSFKTANLENDLQIGGIVDEFLRKKYIYWLEALSLLGSVSEGVLAIENLEILLEGMVKATRLTELVRDARRFVLYHNSAIENSPLQIYASALVFSPARSLTRELFRQDEPKWISAKPAMEDDWNAVIATLEGHGGSVRSVAFSHDSKRIASASIDHTIKIWDASAGRCLATLEGHGGSVRSVAFSHDSKRIASASIDRTIKIWDASTGRRLATLEGHGSFVQSVVFSHDSKQIASASGDHTIKIWDASTGQCLATLEGHGSFVQSVVFSHDSKRIASASGDHTIKIWDASTGQCLATLEGHGGSVRSVAFSHDSKRIASASDDHTIKIWHASTGECVATLEGHSNRVRSVAFSHDSKRIASASDDHTIKIWYASTGQCLATLEGHSHVQSVAFSHDSKRIASASDDHTIKICDARMGQCLATLEGHDDLVRSVAFSHDSKRIASASIDHTIKIWDASTGQCLATLEGHDDLVRSVAFSHDLKRIASASIDHTIKIWDASTGRCLATLEGHSHVQSVAFSHDSKRIASASDDRAVKIWDASTGQCLATYVYEERSFNLKFDPVDPSLLHTDLGTFIIKLATTSAFPHTPTLISSPPLSTLAVYSRGYGLNEDETWITYGGQNLLWLPPEYRPSASAISRSTVAIGCSSGRVLLFKFDCQLLD